MELHFRRTQGGREQLRDLSVDDREVLEENYATGIQIQIVSTSCLL